LVIVVLAFAPTRFAAAEDVQNTLERLRNSGKYAEALTLLKRLIAERQARGELETPLGATLLNNAGELHYKLGLNAEAIPLYERSVAIAEATLKTDTPLTAVTLRNLGTVYQLVGRPADALKAYARSAAIFAKLPNQQIQAATTLNNVATLLQGAKRYQEAEKILLQVLNVYVTTLGENHRYVLAALSNLGSLYSAGGDPIRAEQYARLAVQKADAVYPKDHPQRVPLLRNLGSVYVSKKDWGNAVVVYREAMRIMRKSVSRSYDNRAVELANLSIEPSLQLAIAGDFVNSAMQAIVKDQGGGQGAVDLVNEVFLAGQWRPSVTGSSLLQMAVRASSGDDSLSRLVRQRQDLVTRWQAVSKEIEAQTASASGVLRAKLAELADIDISLAAIDTSLKEAYPNYSALLRPEPLTLQATQKLLREDEALIFFIETGGPTWVWAVTKTDKTLSLLNMTPQQLTEQVASFRCGLDASAWTDPASWPEQTARDALRKQQQRRMYTRCQSASPKGVVNGVLPFDVSRAHGLYKAMFGAAEKTITGKHLIVVPSPSLLGLPFAALVTEAAREDMPYRDVKWLGTRQPLSILPSLSSLAILRGNVSPSAAPRSYIGIGNPLLDGDASAAAQRDLAALAREKQSCRGGNRPRVAAKLASAVARRAAPADFSDETGIDIALLKAQPPLPETADELCRVAETVGGGTETVLLGEQATEARVKALSAEGSLSQYRIVHFATHGLIAGDLPGVAEPALLLTPPATAKAGDDGLLKASDIATLKLDANWVVLSACNTAAAQGEGSEAFSGLTRAFFYAGARSLLVTHWEVESNAAVELTTHAFSALQGQRISQAEAMRRSMADLVANTKIPNASHPATWAPFTLVGDGWRQADR
jgi:CHAT domain-containing protein/tetratricopeptide (TPR) repeat protein